MRFLKKILRGIYTPSANGKKKPNPQNIAKITLDAQRRLGDIKRKKAVAQKLHGSSSSTKPVFINSSKTETPTEQNSTQKLILPTQPSKKGCDDSSTDGSDDDFSGVGLEIEIGVNCNHDEHSRDKENDQEEEIKKRIAQEIQDRIQRTSHHQAVHEAWIRLQKLFEKDKNNQCVRSIMKSGRLSDHKYIIAHAPECPRLREQRVKRSISQSRERSRGFSLGL